MTTLAYLFVVVSLCVLGAAYQTQTGWLYLMGAAGLGIVPMSWVIAAWEMRGIRVHAFPVAPADQGGSVTVQLAVERDAVGTAYGLQLLLPERPPGRRFSWVRTHLVPANWRNRAVSGVSRSRRATVTFELPAPRRGEFHLPAFILQSAYPLGLVACIRHIRPAGTYFVFPVGPHLMDVPWLSPAGKDRGARARFEAGPGSAPRGVREYRPGDPWRQIHWRTTARQGTPHVKETEREQGETLVLYLDMRAEVHTPASVEHIVTIAASLLDLAHMQGREVVLATQPEAAPVDDGVGDNREGVWLARVNPVAGAAAPGGSEGAVLISPTYVPGWQHWAQHFVYCPAGAANPMDATAFCPAGADIPTALADERLP